MKHLPPELLNLYAVYYWYQLVFVAARKGIYLELSTKNNEIVIYSWNGGYLYGEYHYEISNLNRFDHHVQLINYVRNL